MTTRDQYNQMIAALEAAREGKPVDCRPKGSTAKWVNDVLPSWNFDCWEYRPAPEPKPPRWVAWTFETCPPLGTVIRWKVTNAAMMITAKSKAEIATGYGWESYSEVFARCEQLDGSPCGTLVKEEE